MASIGSLIFCTDCGNLLRESSGDQNAILVCELCGTKNKDTASKTITSESKANAFPSALRSKRSAVQTLTAADRKGDAIVQQACPECDHPEMRFYTLQLRSADEGSTVFYSCDKCGHKYDLSSAPTDPTDPKILIIHCTLNSNAIYLFPPDLTQTTEQH
ncbi:DNA-directed RNA polymerase I core subunit rpa12 [Onygenales sp. PD_12]|nr:DNA-directed RNA polymerase I core subunit rpa12 [Emmonsiellopsis sp. PD_33]KAK2785828.1 DNA-directed RNA polymerase I core subunit rpa12 [Onygenales sp. PD_12]KAK2807471.1 DNA-directed RNA polymerase I core subunit rpa12 [Onygenales sp. PD_10]